MTVIGIDVSKYNYGWNPDNALKSIGFVIQRAGYGSQYGCYKDEKFDEINLQVQKLPVRGAYWYFSSFVNWKTQADYFLKTTKNLNFHFYCADYETAFNTLNARTIAEVAEFVKYIKSETGKKCLFYFNPNVYKTFIKFYGYTNWLNQQDLWVAQYPYSIGQTPLAIKPSMPNEILNWKFWQFGGGDVNFTAGRKAGKDYGGGLEGMDLNYFNGDLSQLYDWCGITNIPNPIPDPTPIPDPIPTGGTLVTITVSSLNVRAGAGTSYVLMGSVKYGQKIDILEFKQIGNDVWGRMNLGWICLKLGNLFYSDKKDFSDVFPPPVITPSEQEIFTGEFQYAIPRYVHLGPAIIAGSDAPRQNHPNYYLDETEMKFVWDLNKNNQKIMDLFLADNVGPTKGINGNGKVIYIPAAWSGNLVRVLGRSGDWIKVDCISLSNLPSVNKVNHIKTPHLVHRMTTVNQNNQFVGFPKNADGTLSAWETLDDPLFTEDGELWFPVEWFISTGNTMGNSLNVRSSPNVSNNVVGNLPRNSNFSVSSLSVDLSNNIWGYIGLNKWICLKLGQNSLTSWILK